MMKSETKIQEMFRFLNLIFIIYSVVLYYTAPTDFNFNFCLAINISIVIQAIMYFVFTKRSLVSFEFFFMFSFYFVNFIYPVFYFNTDPTFSVFGFPFNYHIICKSTAIAFVAFTTFIFGLTIRKNTTEKYFSFEPKVFSNSFFRNSLLLFLFLSIYYISSIGAAFFNGYEWYVDEKNYNPIVSFMYIAALLFSMFVFYVPNNKKKNQYLFIIVFFIFLYLLSGSRNMPLGLSLILLVSFNDKVKKIPTPLFIATLAFGIFLLSFIANARGGGVSDSTYIQEGMKASEANSIIDIAGDLVCNNRNLYVLVDFADNKGFTFGASMLTSVLGIIPYAGTLVSEISGIPLDFFQASRITTFLEFGFGSDYGLGGNMVGDVYLSFGFIGVFIAFFLFGFFVSTIISNYTHNVKYYIIYCILLSDSVFMNRESYFLSLRSVIYSLIIFWLLNNIFQKQSLKSINEF